MPDPEETSVDAITGDEIAGKAQPASSHTHNAFTALMSSRAPKTSTQNGPKPSKSSKQLLQTFSARNGLGRYTQHPESLSADERIYFNDDCVAIHDMYPKASVHTLLLPISAERKLLHPFDAFEDATFLAMVQKETRTLKHIVAAELRRKYGKFSAQDQAREAVLNGDIDLPENVELPVGRDWEKDVKAGIHAHPSMNHLHVHVLTVDHVSSCMRHRKHYNSFKTPFFIDIADFPLAEDDIRRHPGREGYLDMDLKCWRCGKNFGNKFARLKEHLAKEFEAWKAE
ncbi:Aprataxin-like protein [Phlyctema vagabunda]|uniref:Aprataxin-like protein n=1 Tax=Phlyctema vagabunda TaxID=108571 RepID=A0ABR4PJA1_9HELO